MKSLIRLSIAVGISFILHPGCTEIEYPTPRPIPIIETVSVSEINENGAEFTLNIVQDGIDNIKEFGFTWGINFAPRLEINDTILIKEEIGIGEYTTKVDFGIMPQATYLVRAFARTPQGNAYGNTIEFTSQGSKKSPWKFTNIENSFNIRGQVIPFGDNLYRIEPASKNVHVFNPFNFDIAKKSNIPLRVLRLNQMYTFEANERLYLASLDSEDLLRYDPTIDRWDVVNSDLPFVISLDQDLEVFSFDNKGYFVSGEFAYIYDPATDNWTSFNLPPVGVVYTGFQVHDKGYIIGSSGGEENCWQLDPDQLTWKSIQPFPDTIGTNMFSMEFDDFVSVGTIESITLSNLEVSNKGRIWRLNPTSETWEFHSALAAPDIPSSYITFTWLNKGYIVYPVNFISSRAVIYFEYDPLKGL